jgi:hypothetical protein
MHGVAVPGVLLAVALFSAIESLRCLAEHLLVSATIYALGAATLAVVAGKLALDVVT